MKYEKRSEESNTKYNLAAPGQKALEELHKCPGQRCFIKLHK